MSKIGNFILTLLSILFLILINLVENQNRGHMVPDEEGFMRFEFDEITSTITNQPNAQNPITVADTDLSNATQINSSASRIANIMDASDLTTISNRINDSMIRINNGSSILLNSLNITTDAHTATISDRRNIVTTTEVTIDPDLLAPVVTESFFVSSDFTYLTDSIKTILPVTATAIPILIPLTLPPVTRAAERNSTLKDNDDEDDDDEDEDDDDKELKNQLNTSETPTSINVTSISGILASYLNNSTTTRVLIENSQKLRNDTSSTPNPNTEMAINRSETAFPALLVTTTAKIQTFLPIENETNTLNINKLYETFSIPPLTNSSLSSNISSLQKIFSNLTNPLAQVAATFLNVSTSNLTIQNSSASDNNSSLSVITTNLTDILNPSINNITSLNTLILSERIKMVPQVTNVSETLATTTTSLIPEEQYQTILQRPEVLGSFLIPSLLSILDSVITTRARNSNRMTNLTCPSINCPFTCLAGTKLDKSKCPTCQCCPICTIKTCIDNKEIVYVKNIDGCHICHCCKITNLVCPFGFLYNGNGCPQICAKTRQ